jgi:hypothetical protein
MKSLSLGFRRGKFTLATLKPPLSSREVLGRRCSGFLGILGLKEMANMER